MKENGFRPDCRVSPGEILAEWMLAHNASMADVSKRTGLTHRTISDILTGRARITKRIAHQLSALNHLDADAWLALEKGNER